MRSSDVDAGRDDELSGGAVGCGEVGADKAAARQAAWGAAAGARGTRSSKETHVTGRVSVLRCKDCISLGGAT